jgi:hypothetical protein
MCKLGLFRSSALSIVLSDTGSPADTRHSASRGQNSISLGPKYGLPCCVLNRNTAIKDITLEMAIPREIR